MSTTRTQRVLVDWDNGTEDGHAPAADLPPRELDLPHELVWEELDGITAEGTVADYLSDEHGWCVEGWTAIEPSPSATYHRRDRGNPDTEPHLTARSGQHVTILRELGGTERDAEVGAMFHVRFPDGHEADVFAWELERPLAGVLELDREIAALQASDRELERGTR